MPSDSRRQASTSSASMRSVRSGSDDRLTFIAPADGSYLVRVSDVRGFSGDRFVYRLTVREAKPDFNVVLSQQDAWSKRWENEIAPLL